MYSPDFGSRNFSQAFARQKVGVKQVEEKIWLVSFMRYDLGFFDHETSRSESAENPFGAKVFLAWSCCPQRGR